MTKKQKKNIIRIIITIVLLIAINIIPVKGIVRASLFLIAYIIIGYDIVIKAVKGVINGRVFDENFLMTIATIGAISLAIIDKSGDYNEAIAVMLFYQIGEWFQSYAVGKSRKNIASLMDIRPDFANIKKDGELVQVFPDEIAIGSQIVVKIGEKIPIDGVVIKGNSTLNISALTGESLPREVSEGDEVVSGSINLNGELVIKTTKEFSESTVCKILDLVENASNRKSKSENFISKFSRVYTPIVCVCALILAIFPPLISLAIGQNANFAEWIYRGLTFLVISCPCALVVSVPLAFFAGIGGASKQGILIKGSNYLETLSKTKYVVFDKTGTLTEGVFEVTGVYENIIDKQTLIEYATLCEYASSHPISKSLQKAYGKPIDINRVNNVREISGKGVMAEVDGKKLAVGNSKLMDMLDIEYHLCQEIGTIAYVAIDGKFVGCIVISDIIKEGSKKAIEELKKIGVSKTVMLTGDSEKVANSVATALNLDDYYSELLPNDKVNKLEQMLCTVNKGEKVAFVGDGINDAPVLSRADVGIGMGGIGCDAAIESADVVIMDDNPRKISQAIKISQKCIRIVNQNVYFAIGVKLICLILGAIGFANMWLAIFADVGVMVLAILNSIRALIIKKL